MIPASKAIGRAPGRQSSAAFVLAGTMLLSFVLGSIHSFSVLLPVSEATFTTSRTLASLTYSFALVALALAVLLGHRAYARFSPATLVLAIGVLAATGCLISGTASSLGAVWIGYSILFGTANGLGYGYSLQFAGQAMPGRTGLAMGAVTAAYALGSVAFPVPMRMALDLGGWTGALLMLAGSMLAIAALSATLLAYSGLRYRTAQPDGMAVTVAWGPVLPLWVAYGCAVSAGLMAIGHATGIAAAAGIAENLAVAAPMVIALSNLLGALLSGALLDRFSGRLILGLLTLLSASALMMMALMPHAQITLAGLAAVGFAYGGTISVYPAFISRQFGPDAGTVVYGRVFTAWAVGGLLGPGVAGLLFDLQQNYQAALIAAAGLALLSPLFLKPSADNL